MNSVKSKSVVSETISSLILLSKFHKNILNYGSTSNSVVDKFKRKDIKYC